MSLISKAFRFALSTALVDLVCRYLIKVVSKIYVFVQQGKIEAERVDQLAKPANGLFNELRREHVMGGFQCSAL